ncbi:hypothetical protein OSTOST_21533, partial [Ostertagia ostertagi]
IQAREVDTVPIRSSEPVTITIHVIDVNDNPPQFEQPIYTVNVSTFGDERPVVKVGVLYRADKGAMRIFRQQEAPLTRKWDISFPKIKETAHIGNRFLLLSWLHLVHGSWFTFSSIEYHLQVTNGAEGRFRYDDPTNTLYVNGDLTPGERYQVVIEATDGGGKSSQAIVVVLATHSVFSLASLAPLPGMETFVPNPAAYLTTPTVATSAGGSYF